MAKSKRWYEYPGPEDTPEWIKHIGNKYKLAGIVLEGEGESKLLLLPLSKDYENRPWYAGLRDAKGAHIDDYHAHTYSPQMWSEILRRSDDPLVYGEDKAWVRKARWVISGFVQQGVWVRDRLQCLFCGAKMGEALLTIDHFTPLELGGANDTSNYVTACRRCNKRKGNQNPREYCAAQGLVYEDFVSYLNGEVGLLVFKHLEE
jgi:hypothetical protein